MRFTGLIEDDASSLWLYTACGMVRITRSEVEAWAADPKRAVHTTLFGEADGVRVHVPLKPFTPVVTKVSRWETMVRTSGWRQPD